MHGQHVVMTVNLTKLGCVAEITKSEVIGGWRRSHKLHLHKVAPASQILMYEFLFQLKPFSCCSMIHLLHKCLFYFNSLAIQLSL